MIILKTKKMCKHVVQTLPGLLRYVPKRYKTVQMCEKSILENGGTLKSVPDCCKNQESRMKQLIFTSYIRIFP